MNLEDSYCRLCAKSKPRNKHLNLHLDTVKKYEIIEKLARVNAATDFDDESLPKTVCLECAFTLNRAFDFVIAVEYAQYSLAQLFEAPIVKKEKVETSDFFRRDSTDSSTKIDETKFALKRESGDEANDEDSYVNYPETYSGQDSRPRKPSRGENNLDVDSIPLAQLSQLKLSWKNYNWYCTFCETLFSTIEELKRHSIEFHKMCNPYRCTDCKIRKYRLNKFLIHVQRHHKQLKFSCHICFKEFKTVLAACKHKKNHFTTKFTCPGCNTSFSDNEELNQHMEQFCQLKRVRRLPELFQTDGLTCTVCQKTFKNKGGLNAHVLIHMDRNKDHTCEVCGKGFFLKHNLSAHMLSHNDGRPYKCQLCNATFKTPRLLKNHVGIHTNDKPFTCNECGRSFRLQRHLKAHSIIHTDIHPYACPHCDKRFRFKPLLNCHIRLHTGIKPYSCEQCHRDFSNWPNYNKHMKRKHNMDLSKKKHTPDGVFPRDPNTGEVIKQPETNKMIEWKKMMLLKRMGRPSTKNIESDTALIQL